MKVAGSIAACLGANCPTPCCQDNVFIIKEEISFVMGHEAGIFTGDRKLAENCRELIYWDPHKTYVTHCFYEGCKFELNNPQKQKGFPEKGIMCIVFPIHILNSDWVKTGLIRLDIVPETQCPITNRADVITHHFYENILPTLKIRFPRTYRVEFKDSLAELMGMSTFDI